MSSTDQTTEPPGQRHPVLWIALPLASLALALSACSQGGPAAAPTEQETAVQSTTPQPSPSSGSPGPAASSGTATGPATGTATPPPTGPAASAVNAMLTVSIKQDAAAEPAQYVLECVAGAPGPGSTLPNAEAACAALARLGAGFFTARPNKDLICTQQYGGPQTAGISGEVDGTPVLAAFALTDGCEISRWDKVKDILGKPGAQ